jgi:phage tail-like protein
MPAPVSPVGSRTDVVPAYRFLVDLGSGSTAIFNEVSGLEFKVNTEQWKEGGNNEYTQILPGRVEYGNLVLKRGYMITNEMLNWCLKMFNRSGNTITRKNVAVSLIKPGGANGYTNIATWTFRNAYPVKWSGPSVKAADNSVAMESVELAHEGLLVT